MLEENEGDLYFVLDHFLGQMEKFSTDENTALFFLVKKESGQRGQQPL